MNIFTAEFIATALMILLGNGVVATCLLKDTKCEFSSSHSWLIITTAWGFAVFVGVTVAGNISGAHLNPVVSLALALTGRVPWEVIPLYFAGEFLGAAFGAFLVYVFYKEHFKRTEDEALKRACFCTEPAIRKYSSNFFSEFLATFVLIFVILYITGANISLSIDNNASIGLGTIGALPVAILVWVIGLSLGSTTGYAINPCRDLSPRIVLVCLPLKIKPDFAYAWVPFFAPILGGTLASFLYLLLI
ncbi:aquaporin family protein [Campylobacter sp. MIT 21-1685]|uniref:MIP/aquaporin family protein n=1 Tax=unclassified Campylobacter TaxID=2593542 RepID=UPI00224A90EA|nr:MULTISPECIES: MIP/aquaporin family protein [unclassified Campylobacter]MCX2683035.1 aquaporin family protein [Campylobacter sp. MIT 21-1684]MCX2751317.1 aquaporin family protein [Campylobacter sp. MIT 21-1682]MCX2807516.1 aquaporin family protein [Campylobacter sp. MIT 21-1685]